MFTFAYLHNLDLYTNTNAVSTQTQRLTSFPFFTAWWSWFLQQGSTVYDLYNLPFGSGTRWWFGCVFSCWYCRNSDAPNYDVKDVQRLAVRVVSRRSNVYFTNEKDAITLTKDTSGNVVEASAGTIDNQNFMQDNEWKLLHHHKANENGSLCACLPCCNTGKQESKGEAPFHIRMIAVQTTKQAPGHYPKPKMKFVFYMKRQWRYHFFKYGP